MAIKYYVTTANIWYEKMCMDMRISMERMLGGWLRYGANSALN